MRSRGVVAGVLAFSVIAATVPRALAVTDEERAAARAAAGQGADAFDAGRWQDAIDLFSRAEALVHSPIQMLYIARAELKLGQWVKASELLNKIKREGAPAGSPASVKRAVDDAATELASLEPQLPYVATKVTNASGKVEVVMDGEPVPPLLVGLMRPVDPGKHVYQAKSSEGSSDPVTVEAKPGTRQTIELEIKLANAAPPAPAAPAASPPSAPAPAAPPPAGPDMTADTGSSGGPSGLRIASYGALGLGVVGVAVGTVFLVKSGSTQSESDKLCGSGPQCDGSKAAEISSKDKSAASERTVGAIGLIGGGVALAAGVTLFLISGQHASTSALGPSVMPFIGYRTAGVAGRF